MRGRGRSNNRGSPNTSRGSNFNANGARSSTRNWDKPSPAGSEAAPKTSNSGALNKKGNKHDDLAGLRWLPSVSRSSGLEPNGDALRSFRTQEEYWKYIVEKVMDLELSDRKASKHAADRQEKEGNVMILIRKLREGFVATNRKDEFAVQVVERSTHLALLYNSPKDIASSFGYLFDAYPATKIPASKEPSSYTSQKAVGLLHFLHTLLDEYPSQRTSYRLILPNSAHLAIGCPEWSVASEISSALRRNNWWTLDKLTSPQLLRERLTDKPWTAPDTDKDQDEMFDALPERALFHLMHQLRLKVRGSAWPVLRSAYREVVDGPWLERSLMLGKQKEASVSELAEFMRAGVEKGEAGVKDTSGARAWVLRRPA
ncbi:hypothetical protein RhiJN_08428 [Ceratobasidium sp. AG-Ba]|nr:hypothetical protein RhiJN_08428 [Ceratobasidium sp. AG-Ba]